MTAIETPAVMVDYVVLVEDQPGVFALVGIFSATDESNALVQAATERPQSDIFYAAELSVFSREQVAARNIVIDWQPPLP